MEYLVIDTSEQGTWMSYDRDLDLKVEVGPESADRVTLGATWSAAAWVNDRGRQLPETYPRNVFGSCLLAAMGAPRHPYAGPILITGWDPVDEIVDLIAVDRVENAIDTLRYALGIDPDPDGVIHGSKWAKAMRQYAEKVRIAPTPTLRIISGGTR
ncbi:hypothetical protein AB0I72_19490 [Nocardiopsis sp. NPDC049922]|uniref:hypothetical protein n=1 Tax=Nocardiopsis sp. NPDC049922 TaxID=3155157 RepID=UPI0033DE1770